MTDQLQRPLMPKRPTASEDAAPARHPAVFWPDDFAAGEELPPTPAPRPAARPGSGRRIRRLLLYGVSGVVSVVGALVAYVLLVPPSSGAAGAARRMPTITPQQLIDVRADTLAIALEAFGLRTMMFERRQMACVDLARGLVQVDDMWIAYSLARRAQAGSLDSGRAVRDRDLFAGVKRVERRFELSGCTRP